MTSYPVQLIFETIISEEDAGTQYDILNIAVSALQRELREADSMDDVADVFKSMLVNKQKEFPGF